MVLELRPTWCLSDKQVDDLFSIDDWLDEGGNTAVSLNADNWSPGQPIRLTRWMASEKGPNELRQLLGLPTGTRLSLAARWICRTTSDAGTHQGGPEPLPLDGPTTLVLDIPRTIAGSVELETNLLAATSGATDDPLAPAGGALLWSDSWAVPSRQRTITLRGDEMRIPVRRTAFAERFSNTTNALWAVEVDAVTDLYDPVANTVTIFLDEDALRRDFPDREGEPDAGRLPAFVETAIRIEMATALFEVLRADLEDQPDVDSLPDGSVGQLVTQIALSVFGSTDEALEAYENEPVSFTRHLRSTFAPKSWKPGP